MKKQRIITRFSVAIPLIIAFFINGAVILAQSQENLNSAGTQEIQTSQESQESQESQQIEDKALKKMQFLENIREEIRASQKDFQDITNNINDAGDRLEETQGQAKTLSEQLDFLTQQIDQTNSLIQNVQLQIAEKENELVLLYEEMDVKKAAIENQKKMLLEYLQTLYEQENGINNTIDGNSEINIAKLLLSDQTAGDQLQEIRYFSILEKTGLDIFNKLEELVKGLKEDEILLGQRKDKLTSLYARLDEEMRTLAAQKDAKQHLLDETKGEELIYQQLLDESKQQQEQVNEDLKTLQDNLQFIEDKMAEQGDSFNPDDYKSLFSKDKSSIYEFINSTKNEAGDIALRWPVSPSRGISAYFRDPSYKAYFGFAHNAIDIRTPQGSVVRAPADGIVYKVRDNGYGYSYLILAHKGGFMTVYGHVSEFKVEEGEKVFSGQIVALSGGTPGSKGAGLMTTGAHLHFEVMKGGKYVDPLDYLPLSFLPIDSIPDKYKSRITGDKPKVRRENPEDVTYTDADSLTQSIERNAALESMVLTQQQ
jgi:murein DD-endopeptidase MepM/ murein hydrolase activator NlpD